MRIYHPRDKGEGDVETSRFSDAGSQEVQGKSEVREDQVREKTTNRKQTHCKRKRKSSLTSSSSPPKNLNALNRQVRKEDHRKGKLEEESTSVFATGWKKCEKTTEKGSWKRAPPSSLQNGRKVKR
ncbi:hypothetical protein TNCT_374621 [Trichonephila clavata]|uniref:Uncharacterized protein n=1 Tax=Trichonephila clavata TaxID=2740835 RepID=A0A8X6LP89_TRICU|nr:hypothetical protein TNCT_374621 [Trichonephila clavata]